MKTILRVRFEFFIAALFLTLFIMSVIHVGFFKLSDIIFNIVVFISIPLSYLGFKTCRRLMYYVWYGERI